MGSTTWICLPPVHDLATLSSALTAYNSSELLLEPLMLHVCVMPKKTAGANTDGRSGATSAWAAPRGFVFRPCMIWRLCLQP